MAVPEQVYNHMRYGNGARPTAHLAVTGGEYGLSRLPTVTVVATYYPTDRSRPVRRNLPLSAVPATDVANWDWDWEGAEEAFKRANELNPSIAYNHFQYAWLLLVLDRYDEAVVEHELAKELPQHGEPGNGRLNHDRRGGKGSHAAAVQVYIRFCIRIRHAFVDGLARIIFQMHTGDAEGFFAAVDDMPVRVPFTGKQIDASGVS